MQISHTPGYLYRPVDKDIRSDFSATEKKVLQSSTEYWQLIVGIHLLDPVGSRIYITSMSPTRNGYTYFWKIVC